MYLSDGWYGGKSGNSRPDMYMGPQFVSLFACQIDPELLKGEDIEYYQPASTTTEGGLTVQNFGGWKHKLSVKDKWSTDWKVDLFTLISYGEGQRVTFKVTGKTLLVQQVYTQQI